jgi:acyl-coenzyme A thioesterase PaaI-like protein
MSIHFLKASRRADLRAEARILKKGRRQDVVEMSLYDGSGELVGHAVGTFMVLPHMEREPRADPGGKT